MIRKFDKSPIMDQVKITAMQYGLKFVANELNKPYSTLANELNEVDWAKLGLRDALAIVELSQSPDADDLTRRSGSAVLDLLAKKFGRVMFQVPELSDDMTTELNMIAKLSKEYGSLVERMAVAMADGCWSTAEINECIKVSLELLKAGLPIYQYLQKLQAKPGRKACAK